MNKFIINGPSKLNGDVVILGAKNSILPILFSTLLIKESVEIQNISKLKDIDVAVKLLKIIGAKIEYDKSLFINNNNINKYYITCKLIQDIRASIWILSPLLSRFGKVKILLPGGCNIGSRPIDLHIYGLKKLGAKIKLEGKYVKATVNGRLNGNHIVMTKISVGATITIINAAILADGITIIENAACEPEIVDTINFLITTGAKIKGAGTNKIIIQGVKKLKGTIYKVLPDRIEIGTFLVAAAISRGKIKCCANYNISTLLRIVLIKLYKAGADINVGNDWISINMHGKKPKAITINTAPYPGFPTDLQAQFSVLNLIAEGIGKITENVFENRFMHIPELIRMGANIKIKNKTIICYNIKKLFGAKVTATDLRSSVSLILAGCIAEGTTIIKNIYHVDRGYEHIEEKLKYIGANIKRIRD